MNNYIYTNISVVFVVVNIVVVVVIVIGVFAVIILITILRTLKKTLINVITGRLFFKNIPFHGNVCPFACVSLCLKKPNTQLVSPDFWLEKLSLGFSCTDSGFKARQFFQAIS